MSVRHASLLLLALALAGCPTDEGELDVCPAGVESQDAGLVTASVDGTPWEATDGNWTWNADAIKISTSRFDGWSLSIWAQTTTDGVAIVDAFEAGSYPMEIRLRDGTDGAWAQMLGDTGYSYSSTKADGGTLFLTSYAAGVFRGCFDFEGGNDDTEDLWIEDGLLAVEELGL